MLFQDVFNYAAALWFKHCEGYFITLFSTTTRTADSVTAFNGTYHFRSHNLSAESGQVKLHTYPALLQAACIAIVLILWKEKYNSKNKY